MRSRRELLLLELLEPEDTGSRQKPNGRTEKRTSAYRPDKPHVGEIASPTSARALDNAPDTPGFSGFNELQQSWHNRW